MEWPKESKDRMQLGLRNRLELGLEQGRGLSESFLSPFYLCGCTLASLGPKPHDNDDDNCNEEKRQ